MKLGSSDVDQKDSIRDLGGTAIGGVQTRNLAFNAAPSFWAG